MHPAGVDQPVLLNGASVKTYGAQQDDQVASCSPIEQVNSQPAGCVGTRHVFAVLGFLGLASAYMMRVNLCVAIVDMIATPDRKTAPFTNRSASGDIDRCPHGVDSSVDRGLVLGCFFWGYMASQIPGGILADHYGGKNVFGLGILGTSLFTLLGPVAARTSVDLFIIVRVLTGVAEGVTLPSMHVLLSRWVPPSERSTIGAFVYAGMQFGTVVVLPLSGFLCQLQLDNGWPLAFYVPGVAGIVWFVAWYLLASDGPEDHPRIADDEKRFILSSVRGFHQKSVSDIPVRSLITSVPLWAIIVAHTGQAWGFYMLLTELPTYMKTVLHFDMKSNSLLSALPYLGMWIFSNVASVVADTLRKKKYLTTTQTRKVFNSIGFLLPACSLLGAAYTGCNRGLTVALITIASSTNGAIYSGFQVNHIDLAPNFAGITMGLTNCVANVCGFLAPYAVGVIVTSEGSLSQWRLVFLIAAAIYLMTNLFYVTFASGDEQSWNSLNDHQDIELISQTEAVNVTHES